MFETATWICASRSRKLESAWCCSNVDSMLKMVWSFGVKDPDTGGDQSQSGTPRTGWSVVFYLLWAIYIFAFSRCPAWTSRILLCGFRMAKFTICISAAASHKKSTIVPRSIHFTLIFVLSKNAPHFSYLQYQGLELFYLLNLIIVIIGPIQDAVRSYGPLRTV